MALELLDSNTLNRPLSDLHVQRIAKQIVEGKWRFNGDTIKISADKQILDGQHRLWAVAESKTAVQTVIVYGIERDAFATIDTIRRHRTGGDTVALNGARQYRGQIAVALMWLLRWQRGVLETYRNPLNRIENSDVEQMFAAHPQISAAVEAAMKLRSIANPAILAFAYYVMHNKNEEVAEKFFYVLKDPTVGIYHPFYVLRSYFTTNRLRADPLMSIALIFKAANAVKEDREISTVLSWRRHGEHPEKFPELKI